MKTSLAVSTMYADEREVHLQGLTEDSPYCGKGATQRISAAHTKHTPNQLSTLLLVSASCRRQRGRLPEGVSATGSFSMRHRAVVFGNGARVEADMVLRLLAT